MKINTSLFKNEKLYEKVQVQGDYDDKNKKLEFTHDDTIVKINFTDEYINYKRKNNEYDFEIYIDSKDNKSSIKLKEYSKFFEIKVLEANFEVNAHMIIINYRIETEEDVLNKIVIEW